MQPKHLTASLLVHPDDGRYIEAKNFDEEYVMQFAVIAYDFVDDDAINRRLTHREAHLASIKKMVKAGTFLSGGAILDDNGKMIGSSVHVEFESEAELQKWIKNDPYTLGKVWDKVTVHQATLVPVAKFLAE